MGINNGGIFSLGDVSILQQKGNWFEGYWAQDKSRVFTDRYGYVSGGTFQRIDFSTNTTEVVTKGALPYDIWNLAATGNNYYGYFGGGHYMAGGANYISTIYRLDYSNDSANAIERSKFPDSKSQWAAAGNANYGYWGGGTINGTSTHNSTIYRLDYSNDGADAVVKGNVADTTTEHEQGAATGNANYGYWGGGDAYGIEGTTKVDRLDYSNDGVDNVNKGGLLTARQELAAVGNRSYGYFGGGWKGPAGSNLYSSVERIDYSNDTENTVSKGPLSVARQQVIATGNSAYGYFAGGFNQGPNPSVHYSLIDRIDYSNDTPSLSPKGNLIADLPPPGNLTNIKAAVSSSENGLPRQYTTVPDISDTNIQPLGTDYGYFAGGRKVGVDVYSTIDRIDYSSDTGAPQKSYLSQKKTSIAAIGHQSYGYFAGGWAPASPTAVFYSIIERIDYSNDSVNTSLKSAMSASRYNLAAIGNEFYGYFAGGAPGVISTIDRLSYSNDTVFAAPKSTLVAATSIAAVGNLDYGYFAGGWAPASVEYSTISRMDYSNDTISPGAKSDLSAPRYGVAASGNANYAYFGGGNDGTDAVGIIDKFDYSSDTTDAVDKTPTAFSPARAHRAATGNSSYGYFAGGYNGGLPPEWDTEISGIDRINYSNDTVAASGTLSDKRYGAAAVSSRDNALPTTRISNKVDLLLDPRTSAFGGVKYTVSNYGYFGGGYVPGSPVVAQTTVDRIDFSNDTVGARFSTTLTQARTYLAATGNSSYGYFSTGEQVNHTPSLSNTDRLDYFNDYINSVPALTGIFSVGNSGATGNQNYGYWAGGKHTTYYSYIKRLDYSNDTVTPRGFLSLIGPVPRTGRSNLSATGNKDYGYFAGGEADNLPMNTAVSRIDYSNDNTIALTRGPLLEGRLAAAGAGNENYGYFSGGLNTTLGTSSATIDRIDYFNDTVTAAPKGALTAARYYHAGTSSIDCGYWGGGSPGPSFHSDIYRTAFSNDTATSTPKGTLSSSRTYLAAVSARINGFDLLSDYPEGTYGSSNYGYFGGGSTLVTGLSAIDRIDYSNDTARSIEKGPLTHSRWGLSGVGNYHYGYFGGNGQYYYTYVDRIDYFNDTVTASLRAPLGNGRKMWAAVGNDNVSYWAGGYDNSNSLSSIHRLVYANDLVTYGEISGYITQGGSQGMGAAGNKNYAYYAGGYVMDVAYFSRMQRFDYSNDTANTVYTGNLVSFPGGVSAISGTGNKDYGYFGGGSTPSMVSFIDRIDYANDSVGAIYKANLSANKSHTAATGNPNSGYWGGGQNIAPTPNVNYSVLDRIDYSNDTAVVTPKGHLTTEKTHLAAASARENDLSIIGLTSEQFINPGNNTQKGAGAYGWFAGGKDSSPAAVSTLDRLDFTNDTANVVTKGSLSQDKQGVGSIGSLNYGYFGGGYTTQVISFIDRIDYSNNTLSTISATLTASRWGISAIGNENYGYFTAGRTPSPDVYHTTVDRIDYSNDTVRSPFQGPLHPDLGTSWSAATGNKDYGWVAGGWQNPLTSVVNRIDYSNDTAIASTRGSLSAARSYLAATGNENYGYFAGGWTNPSDSRIDRIEYASDTAVVTPKGHLTDKKYGIAATGNKDYGWFAGGLDAIPSPDEYRSTIDRIDYSNDTTASPTQRFLSASNLNLSGSSAAANGLPQ